MWAVATAKPLARGDGPDARPSFATAKAWAVKEIVLFSVCNSVDQYEQDTCSSTFPADKVGTSNVPFLETFRSVAALDKPRASKFIDERRRRRCSTWPVSNQAVEC